MKNLILLISVLFISFSAMAQENLLSLNYGYAFANLDENVDQGQGWRINGSYEFNPLEGKVAHGFVMGYTSISTSSTTILSGQTDLKTITVSSFPIYYAPKLILGDGNFKFFVKGAVGLQFARYKSEGITTITAKDSGFYGGGGTGIMYFFKDNFYLNAEYEIAWVSNSYYNDGWLNSAMGGIGFRF